MKMLSRSLTNLYAPVWAAQFNQQILVSRLFQVYYSVVTSCEFCQESNQRSLETHSVS